MTQGGPGNATNILPLYSYQQAFSFNNLAYGALIGNVMVLIATVFGVFYVRIARQTRMSQRDEGGLSSMARAMPASVDPPVLPAENRETQRTVVRSVTTHVVLAGFGLLVPRARCCGCCWPRSTPRPRGASSGRTSR